MSVKGLGLQPGIQKKSDCSMKLPSVKHMDEAMRFSAQSSRHIRREP